MRKLSFLASLMMVVNQERENIRYISPASSYRSVVGRVGRRVKGYFKKSDGNIKKIEEAKVKRAHKRANRFYCAYLAGDGYYWSTFKRVN